MGRHKLPTQAVVFLQVRILPAVHDAFKTWLESVIGSQQDHVQSALLGYLAMTDAQRCTIQNAFLRVQKGEDVELPDIPGSDLSRDEVDLLEAFRRATPAARQAAMMNLLEADATARSEGTGGKRRRRG